MVYRILVITIAVILIKNEVYAFQQESNYNLQRYTDENGLPQNSITAIGQDKEGYVWLCTQDGLVRFDGNNFSVYDRSALQLISNRFNHLLSSKSGELMALNTDQKPIYIKDGTASLASTELAKKFSSEKIDVLFRSRRSETVSTWPYYPEKWLADVDRIYMYTGAYTLECHEDSVYLWKSRQLVNRQSSVLAAGTGFFPMNGEFYSIAATGDIIRFSAGNTDGPAAGKINLYQHLLKITQPSIPDLHVFWNGCMPDALILYTGHNFYLLSKMDGQLRCKLVLKEFDLQHHNITVTYYDKKNGILYLGSSNNGLFVARPNTFITLSHQGNNEVYYGQLAYDSNTILTAQGSLFNLQQTPRKISGIKDIIAGDYFSIIRDKHGRIWDKQNEFLYVADNASYQLKKYATLQHNISLLYEGLDDKLWIGLRNNGLAVLDISDTANPVIPFLSIPGMINCMNQFSGNQLFVGATSGLYLIEISGKKVIPVNGLEQKNIRSLYLDEENNLWITTQGHGFFLWSKGRLTRFPIDQNGFLSTSHCMIEDGNGFFWITTNRGLFQASKKDLLEYALYGQGALYYHYYDKSYGLYTNEFNGGCQPCAVRLKNGYLSLPSINGLVWFKPEEVRPSFPEGKIFIDRVQLDGREITTNSLQQLPGDLGQLILQVSTPYYGHPQNLQLFYSLNKQKEKPVWYPVPAHGKIILSPLAAGNYELHVRKLNGFGVSNFTEKKLQLLVKPQWYQSNWFYITCAALLIACFFIFYFIRTGYIKKRNQQLEMIVRNKTRELSDQAFLQSRIIRSISHDIQTPLQFQQMLSERIYRQLQEAGNKELTQPARVLHESSQRLQYMVANLLDYLKGQTNRSVLKTRPVHLHSLIEDKKMIFSQIAEEKGTVIHNMVPDVMAVDTDKNLLAVVIHNILDNAVKITHRGEISVYVEQPGSLTIKDTGTGMPAGILSWINTPVNDMNNYATMPEALNGIGLMMVKELAVQLKLKLLVESLRGKGTAFHIYFLE